MGSYILGIFLFLLIQTTISENDNRVARALATATGENAVQTEEQRVVTLGPPRDGTQRAIIDEVSSNNLNSFPADDIARLGPGSELEGYDDNFVDLKQETPLFIPKPYRNETPEEKEAKKKLPPASVPVTQRPLGRTLAPINLVTESPIDASRGFPLPQGSVRRPPQAVPQPQHVVPQPLPPIRPQIPQQQLLLQQQQQQPRPAVISRPQPPVQPPLPPPAVLVRPQPPFQSRPVVISQPRPTITGFRVTMPPTVPPQPQSSQQPAVQQQVTRFFTLPSATHFPAQPQPQAPVTIPTTSPPLTSIPAISPEAFPHIPQAPSSSESAVPAPIPSTSLSQPEEIPLSFARTIRPLETPDRFVQPTTTEDPRFLVTRPRIPIRPQPLPPHAPPRIVLPTATAQTTPPPSGLSTTTSVASVRTGVCKASIFYISAPLRDASRVSFTHFAIAVSVDQCARTCHEFNCAIAHFDPSTGRCEFEPTTAFAIREGQCPRWPAQHYRNNVLARQPIRIFCVQCHRPLRRGRGRNQIAGGRRVRTRMLSAQFTGRVPPNEVRAEFARAHASKIIQPNAPITESEEVRHDLKRQPQSFIINVNAPKSNFKQSERIRSVERETAASVERVSSVRTGESEDLSSKQRISPSNKPNEDISDLSDSGSRESQ